MRAPWDIHESNHETHHGSRLLYWWLRFRNVKGGSKRRYTITTIDAYSEEEPQIANGLSRRTAHYSHSHAPYSHSFLLLYFCSFFSFLAFRPRCIAAILFTLGIFGIFLNRKNVIIILMSVELMLLAVNINLVAFSAYAGDLVGQIFALFILTVAAAEAAIGLAILVVFFRNRGSIAVEDVNLMKG